ncbi:MAG: tRNA (N(6)-L-threonylcarbamoyladenosine(37)-C(2))-methylthiotransferase MtaB [Candidatus Saccharibacteria bacterium]
MKKVAFYTLGCRVNQVETEGIIEQFTGHGYEIVKSHEPADVYVINSCTVTRIADKKSRALIRRVKKENPDSIVVLTGCFGDIASSAGEIPSEVDLVVPNKEKNQLLIRLQEQQNQIGAFIEAAADPSLHSVRFTHRHQRTRGFIKIQDGCENFCSYCIVPYARGPVRSKKPDDVVGEMLNMINLEYKEMVLTGIHIGEYGRDLDDWNLNQLIDYIFYTITGHYRLRLGSIEPLEVNRKLLDIMAHETRMCRHLHVPLQSGSNKVLKLMNRHYTAEQYMQNLEEAAAKIPGVGLAADVMVGFPGEGEHEFMETYRLIEESPLFDVHVFRYSPRPGTPAASFTDMVPESVKNERAHAIIELGKKKKVKFLGSLIGTHLQVLTEQNVSNQVRALSDNYVDVYLDNNVQLNNIYEVKIAKIHRDGLLGSVI